MTLFRFLYLAVGLGLLGGVVANADLGAAGDWLGRMGLVGAAVVFVVYLAAFVVDTASWQLMLTSVDLGPGWLLKLWRVRMVGDAFNQILPAAHFGGEPVKAVMLKKLHGIAYREAVASLIMTKTTNLLAMIGFCAIGFALMLHAGVLPVAFQYVAGGGLVALAAGVGGFFAVQRGRVASLVARRIAHRAFGGRFEHALTLIQDVDDRFVDFYHARPHRFAAALTLSFVNWLLGAVELYLILAFLGHPISLAEAWTVEALIQLVRAGSFYIPANLGAIEAGFVVIIAALTGELELGLAVAVVRRVRDIVWIVWGLWLGWRASFTPRDAMAAAKESES